MVQNQILVTGHLVQRVRGSDGLSSDQISDVYNTLSNKGNFYYVSFVKFIIYSGFHTILITLGRGGSLVYNHYSTAAYLHKE